MSYKVVDEKGKVVALGLTKNQATNFARNVNPAKPRPTPKPGPKIKPNPDKFPATALPYKITVKNKGAVALLAAFKFYENANEWANAIKKAHPSVSAKITQSNKLV